MTPRTLILAAGILLALCGLAQAGVRICGDRYCDDGAPAAVSWPGSGKPGVSLNGVVAPLAAKAREIVAACGSRVISAVRHTRVRGSGRMSLHASGRAVDLAGNPSCIYAHLRNWPGGVSTDYSRVRCGRKRCPHVHVSYSPGGAEWGLRFAHYSRRRS